MSVNTENGSAQGQTTVLEKESVYASLFDKINLTPATSLGDINAFLDDAALSDAPAGERLTAAMQVFMDCIRKSGQPVEKLDKTLIDHHIAELDFQISRQLDAVMHHAEFQKVESLWRGLKQLVDNTDYRQNVKTEILDVSKDDLRQDFEDAPELIQKDLPIHLYDLGTGNQVKIPSEVMIPETREFEFANLGFIPLSYYKNRDYACFFSANSAQKPALYDTADATANSRINARLPYIFLLSRIAHYLKLIQRENIGTTKDRRLLELELNTWVRSLVTEMTDPGDELQASHPLRDAKVVVEDIEDNPGFFRVKLFAVPHFQVEGMDVNLSLVSQMPKAKA
ncbi:TPA: type VI secretion system contractile sheath large subunit [Enterobacter cloacae]|nr:type VI secretion system contractile sheath large subunit [Enterobacter cloacae]